MVISVTVIKIKELINYIIEFEYLIIFIKINYFRIKAFKDNYNYCIRKIIFINIFHLESMKVVFKIKKKIMVSIALFVIIIFENY